MPVFGLFVGGSSITEMYIMVGSAKIAYGNFISSVVNFLIMAFVIFCMVKAINSLKNKKQKATEEESPAPSKPSNEEILLAEIRDLLKKQS
jgi:large conductance mechanosensitive channel